MEIGLMLVCHKLASIGRNSDQIMLRIPYEKKSFQKGLVREPPQQSTMLVPQQNFNQQLNHVRHKIIAVSYQGRTYI